MRVVAAAVIAALAWPAAATADGSVRAFCQAGQGLWAVGDGGLILRSDDGGASWRRLPCSSRADLAAVHFTDEKTGYFFGSRCIPAHPTGQTVGVIIGTADGGESFRFVPADGLAGLAGGRMEGARGIVFGRPTRRCGGGVWFTVSAGRPWIRVKSKSRGAVGGGAFLDGWKACLVGPDHRILLLQGLQAEPQAEISSDAALTAVCRAAADACWAVGENASVLLVQPSQRKWRDLTLPLPAGTRRLVDLEAAAAGAAKVYVAGGLTGKVFCGDRDGASLRALPAPTPGPVHALHVTADGRLLAGGDGGRIWRSAQLPRPTASAPAAPQQDLQWKLVHGKSTVDVLFIAGPGDVSILPAVAAHVSAGADVAVVYAAVPQIPRLPAGPGVRADAPLRSSASSLGAGGAAILMDFPSIAGAADAADLSEEQILQRLSARVDAPARGELLRQMVAAIRLYRPRVLAHGPTDQGRRGIAAENRLLARLASEAATLAAEPKAYPELLPLGLGPWAVGRVYAGFEGNDRYIPPWQKLPPPAKHNVAAMFDGRRYPTSAGMNLSMTALAAAAMLPWVAALDRPAQRTAYSCSMVVPPQPLFTSGLSPARLSLRAAAPVGEAIASGAVLLVPALRRQELSGAVDPLLRAAREHPNDPLPADMLYLLVGQMLEQGDLQGAAAVLRAFIAHGQAHPLAGKARFLALVMSSSGEWSQQVRLFRRAGSGANGVIPPSAPAATDAINFPAAIARMQTWPLRAWIQDENGIALLAKAQERLADNRKAAVAAWKRLIELTPQPQWREYARTELVALRAVAATDIGDGLVAARTDANAKIDGILNEEFWKGIFPVVLKPVPDKPASDAPVTARLAGSPAHLAVGIGIGLSIATGRQEAPPWRLTVAIDADRDTWTQLVLRCDSTGSRSLELLTRWGPAAALPPGLMPVQARKGPAGWTIELAVPHSLMGTSADKTQLIRLQICANVGAGQAAGATLYLAPQADDRLLPYRYGLVALPAAGRQ